MADMLIIFLKSSPSHLGITQVTNDTDRYGYFFDADVKAKSC